MTQPAAHVLMPTGNPLLRSTALLLLFCILSLASYSGTARDLALADLGNHAVLSQLQANELIPASAISGHCQREQSLADDSECDPAAISPDPRRPFATQSAPRHYLPEASPRPRRPAHAQNTPRAPPYPIV